MKAPVAVLPPINVQISECKEFIERSDREGGFVRSEPVGPDYRTRDLPNHILHVRRQKFVWSNWEGNQPVEAGAGPFGEIGGVGRTPKESAAGRILRRCATNFIEWWSRNRQRSTHVFLFFLRMKNCPRTRSTIRVCRQHLPGHEELWVEPPVCTTQRVSWSTFIAM